MNSHSENTTPPKINFLDPAHPDNYISNMGFPFRWQDDLSGTLPEAVSSFFDQRETARDIEIIRNFLIHYIYAPIWLSWQSIPLSEISKNITKRQKKILLLRDSVKKIESRSDIEDFINQALEIGLDPL